MSRCRECAGPARVAGLCFDCLYAAKRADRARAHAALSGCSVPGCEGPHQARGLCGAHYARSRRGVAVVPAAPEPLHAEGWGRPDTGAPRRRPMEVLLEELAERNGVPCWPIAWVAWVTRSASGRLAAQAHRDPPGGEAA